MKMELIQPFINAADAVLSQGLRSPMIIGNLSMEEEAYRRKGIAAAPLESGFESMAPAAAPTNCFR